MWLSNIRSSTSSKRLWSRLSTKLKICKGSLSTRLKHLNHLFLSASDNFMKKWLSVLWQMWVMKRLIQTLVMIYPLKGVKLKLILQVILWQKKSTKLKSKTSNMKESSTIWKLLSKTRVKTLKLFMTSGSFSLTAETSKLKFKTILNYWLVSMKPTLYQSFKKWCRTRLNSTRRYRWKWRLIMKGISTRRLHKCNTSSHFRMMTFMETTSSSLRE